MRGDMYMTKGKERPWAIAKVRGGVWNDLQKMMLRARLETCAIQSDPIGGKPLHNSPIAIGPRKYYLRERTA